MERTSPFQLTPWVRRLIVANAVVYLLAITVFTGRWFLELFAFSPFGLVQKPWTLVTYMFVHGGFLHLAFNMLMLFFFGPPVENRLGGTAFIRFYLVCGLGGPLLAFAMSLLMPVAPFVGASAAVFGVALAFAMHWPDARIFIFPLPFPVPVKFLVGLLVAMDLVPLVFGVDDGVAHLAHLGGLLAGFLYLRAQHWLTQSARPAGSGTSPVRVLVPQRPSEERAAESAPPREPRAPTQEELSDEVDRVLDKISEGGLSSLTVAERKFLHEFSRRMRRR